MKVGKLSTCLCSQSSIVVKDMQTFSIGVSLFVVYLSFIKCLQNTVVHCSMYIEVHKNESRINCLYV